MKFEFEEPTPKLCRETRAFLLSNQEYLLETLKWGFRGYSRYTKNCGIVKSILEKLSKFLDLDFSDEEEIQNRRDPEIGDIWMTLDQDVSLGFSLLANPYSIFEDYPPEADSLRKRRNFEKLFKPIAKHDRQ